MLMIEGFIWLMLLKADSPAPPTTESPVSATALHSSFSLQGQNSIVGTVTNQSRRPVENLRVELLDEVDGLLASTYTNGTGRYAFYRLSTGIFQVRVLTTVTDYQSRTERVTIVGSILGGRGSQSEHLDIILPLKRGLRNTDSPVRAAPGTVFAQEVPDQARKVYEQAVREVDGDKLKEKGLLGLQQAIKLFPEYYAALDLLGHEYVKRGDYEAARSVLTKAVTVNSRGYSSWYALGYAQYKLRLLPAAVESLDKAVSFNADSADTHLLLGTAQRMQQRWDAAEIHLKRAKSLSRKPIPEIHWQLALLYNQTGRFVIAADELELFLKAQPDSRDEAKIRKVIGDLRKKG